MCFFFPFHYALGEKKKKKKKRKKKKKKKKGFSLPTQNHLTFWSKE